jgi:hypothetical protein
MMMSRYLQTLKFLSPIVSVGRYHTSRTSGSVYAGLTPFFFFGNGKLFLRQGKLVSGRLDTVERAAAVAKAFRGLLRGDVALRLCHELVADEELSYSGAAQEGWVEVDVEVAGFDLPGGAGERCLVETHAYNVKSAYVTLVIAVN